MNKLVMNKEDIEDVIRDIESGDECRVIVKKFSTIDQLEEVLFNKRTEKKYTVFSSDMEKDIILNRL